MREINQIDKKYDITFIGSSGYNLPAHYNRLIFLTKLFEKTNIFGWLEEEQFKIQNPLKRKLHNFLRENFIYLPEFILKKLSFHKIFDEILYEKKILNNLNLNSIPQKIKNQFKERVEQSTWGLSMYESIASSYCSLNIHMAKSNESGNMRLFEITGMGTCCLTEKHSNTDELFNESEIIQYKNIDDCIEKIHFINNNKELASEIAKRGQKKTLLKHSQKSRAKQLNEIIKENI